MAKAARATISDVAKAAKTGKTSISRYLNGEKHLLSDDLLARIEKAIAELNYRPSLMARGLKHGRTRLIGLIIADITNPYSVNVLSGIEAACREKGFTLLVCNTNNEVDQELHYLDLLRVAIRLKGLWLMRSACAKKASTVCSNPRCRWCLSTVKSPISPVMSWGWITPRPPPPPPSIW